MQIVVVGLNHRSAPIAIRERLAFQREELPAALARLLGSVDEGLILSTCNRVEVYGVAGHAETGIRTLETFLADGRGLSREELSAHSYSANHDEAVRHLFRVASGIDSMVRGEVEILSQLRAAIESARGAGALGQVLSRLGDSAIRAAREVRGRTAAGRERQSLVSLAIEAAQKRCPLDQASILVLGAGETAEAVLERLVRLGVAPARVVVTSRNFERANTVARRHGAAAIRWEDRRAAFASAQVIVGCTSAPGAVVGPLDFPNGMSRELLCLDLGVPRDIDPALAGFPGVSLVDLDSLRAPADQLTEANGGPESTRAESIVGDEVRRFMAWWRSRDVVPMITALREHAETIAEGEIRHALASMPDADPKDEIAIRALVDRVTRKLLHRPFSALKNDSEGANMALVLQRLFGLARDATTNSAGASAPSTMSGAASASASLFARAAGLQRTPRPPIWLMRQAGRILPEYRALRERWGLLEICHQPELCAEVTLQPMRRMPLDAAVLFADIMLPLAAVGIELDLVDNVGPVIAHPIRDASGVTALREIEPTGDVPYVLETIRLVKRELGPSRGVIGFAGAPFTLASYLIEGRPSRDFARTKAMMYSEPALWHSLMDRLTDIMTTYLRAQVAAGVDAIQLFDSWVGCLSAHDYAEFARPYSRRIFAALSETRIPMIHFGTNTAALLDMMRDDGASIIGVDWRLPLDEAWERIGYTRGIQGNLDPAALLAPPRVFEAQARDVLRRAAGRPGHIFNLGHGVLPSTPLDHVMRLVDFVQQQAVLAPDEHAMAVV